MIDWQKNCSDAMWNLFAYRPTGSTPEDVEADKQALKENVARLIRLTTQKVAGIHLRRDGTVEPVPGTISMEDEPLIVTSILVAASRLALGGYFGEMPEKVSQNVFGDE